MVETYITSESALPTLAVHFPEFRVTGTGCADHRTRVDISVNSNASKYHD